MLNFVLTQFPTQQNQADVNLLQMLWNLIRLIQPSRGNVQPSHYWSHTWKWISSLLAKSTEKVTQEDGCGFCLISFIFGATIKSNLYSPHKHMTCSEMLEFVHHLMIPLQQWCRTMVIRS